MKKDVKEFAAWLAEKGKAAATREKYVRDAAAFLAWLGGREIEQETLAAYREYLAEHHKSAAVNAALAAVNGYLAFCDLGTLKLPALKVQKRIFAPDERELTKAEYERLLAAAKARRNERLWLLLQTVCSTGVRVSEIRFITVECLATARTEVANKGKRRTVFLPHALCKALKSYCKERGIASGSIFVTRNGKPLDRSNIHHEMKGLCKAAHVSPAKVFPHNLRHLFARVYYAAKKDIVRLADLLGHSSINTTRIYTMETGNTHRRQIEKLGLLRC